MLVIDYLLIIALVVIIVYLYFTSTTKKFENRIQKLENQIKFKSNETILIVDDEIFNHDLFSMILSDVCEFRMAKDGETAIEMCQNEYYPVIFMDLNLGSGINGIDTANKIKENV
jgi:PleD family two-component response regulator